MTYDLSTFKTNKSTPPGRIRNYLAEQEAGKSNLLPFSCKLRVYKNSLIETLIASSKDLRWGAGVKLILDQYKAESPVPNKVNWFFYLPESHPDYNKLTEYQKTFVVNSRESEALSYYLIVVKDSMEDARTSQGVSIEQSWELFYEYILDGNDVELPIVIDLSALRPCGTTNSQGLTATGAIGDGSEESNIASFFAIYDYIARYAAAPSIGALLQLFGVLNNTIRRGGLYKNGIITSSMWYESSEIHNYLDFPLIEIPGSHKKGISFDNGVLAEKELVTKILKKTMEESLFHEKREKDSNIYKNVCIALDIADNGTCLLWRVNLGQCLTPQDIIAAYVESTLHLCEIHTTWRLLNPEKALNSAPLEDDRQIAIDVMGLANCLRIWGINYEQFNIALKDFLGQSDGETVSVRALELVYALADGMETATEAADQYMIKRGLPLLERIFCVEPAQSHSYETVDAEGFTTCRAIFPPVGKRVTRVSDTQKNKTYRHGNVETTKEVSGETYQLTCELFQKLMNRTGRAHGISYDLRVPATEEWFEDFVLDSSLKGKYYTEVQSADQSYLEKKAGSASMEEQEACSLANPGSCTLCEE
jgi:hypothetical protein